MNENAVRPFCVESLAESGDQSREKGIERLARGHDVEIDVGNDSGYCKNLVEHLAVLGGHADTNVDAVGALKRVNHGKHLDSFGSCAEHDNDFSRR